MAPIDTKHLKALVKADVTPAVLLKAVGGPSIAHIAGIAGVSYTLAHRIAAQRISWESDAEGTRAVRRAIQETLGVVIWDL